MADVPATAEPGKRNFFRTASQVADWLEEGQLQLDEAKKAKGNLVDSAGQAQGLEGVSMDPAAPPFYPRRISESRPAATATQGLASTAPVPWVPTVTEEWLTAAREAERPLDAMDPRAYGMAASLPAMKSSRPFSVTDDFNHWRSSDPGLAVAVAAVKALCSVIKQSSSTTMMGLEKELKEAAIVLKEWDKTSISLSAGCDLFTRYVTRTAGVPTEEFATGKARLLERGEKFSDISFMARKTIAELGQEFVRDGSVILTHGFSRVVIMLLKAAAASEKNFTVICTEGRPKLTALQVANELTAAGITVKVILDSAVAFMMSRVDMVLLGADGVVESGGIINMIGTYQIAMVARALKKPVYVAAESYKFARLYPLDQQDLPVEEQPVDFQSKFPDSVATQNPTRDYTPPHHLTLLFTDLGVLTPSAVSDELIQLYL